jgi:hypothetical protein
VVWVILHMFNHLVWHGKSPTEKCISGFEEKMYHSLMQSQCAKRCVQKPWR